MRIARFEDETGARRRGLLDESGETAAVVEGDLAAGWAPTGETARVARLLAPVEPRAILCVGLNYRGHAAETKQPIPRRPVLFMKNPAAVQAPGGPIALPPEMVERPEVDYEVELAVVLGRDARRVSAGDALRHVAGYTIANDVSARRLQRRGGQWVRGKSLDTFCPLGPVLATPDEVPDPQDLHVETRIGGERLQSSSTADMIFSVAELIADLSREMTLLTGTVLLTGTPPGVGFVREPPRFLRPGDVVELEIERIGVLRNPVVLAQSAAGASW